jgi:hypothetical protein
MSLASFPTPVLADAVVRLGLPVRQAPPGAVEEQMGPHLMSGTTPVVDRPRMFGREPSGPPLPWARPDQRLRAARTYWVVTVGQSQRPHVRPYWGCWTGEVFLFSTMSRALNNVRANPRASVHLDSVSDVVVVEGQAGVVVDSEGLQSFVEDYNRKYDWNLEVRGQRVGDDQGASGNVVTVQADVVYGWQQSVERATKWQLATPG